MEDMPAELWRSSKILPLFDNILSMGQQFSTQVKHNLGRSLLSLSEPSNG